MTSLQLFSTDIPAVVHLKREPFDVRIDRKTPWGNPYPLRNEGERGKVIQQYANWLALDDGAAWVREHLPELQGKRLGCWCAPKACHGHTLARLANSLPENWAALSDSERKTWIFERVVL